mgnify:CR=1 FL=1
MIIISILFLCIFLDTFFFILEYNYKSANGWFRWCKNKNVKNKSNNYRFLIFNVLTFGLFIHIEHAQHIHKKMRSLYKKRTQFFNDNFCNHKPLLHGKLTNFNSYWTHFLNAISVHFLYGERIFMRCTTDKKSSGGGPLPKWTAGAIEQEKSTFPNCPFHSCQFKFGHGISRFRIGTPTRIGPN